MLKNIPGDKLIMFSVLGLTLVILGLISIFAVNESKTTSANGMLVSYAGTDSQKPKVSVAEKFSDLGKMKVNEEKKAVFELKNTGSKPLQISNVSSSCDCTYAQLTINNAKSQEFGMHAKSNWIGTLAPGEKAVLEVIYRPYIMPVKGVVTRDVYLNTNDPDNSRLTFSVKAFVE